MASSDRCLRIILPMVLLGCAVMAHAQDRPVRSVAGLGVPVPVQRLAAVRAGFDLGDGLEVSFGIQRAVYVDGNLITYLNVSIPDIAHMTTQQAVALATALGTVNVQVGSGNTFGPASASPAGTRTAAQGASGNAAGQGAASALAQINTGVMATTAQAGASADAQNSSSNPLYSSTVIPAATTQASAATVIQNTVDNQVIRSLTTLNVAVNALSALRNQGLQQSLQAAQQLQTMSH